MSFEKELRDLIAESKFGSDRRNLLKVVLGEWQRKSVGKAASDESGYNVIKGMIKANEEVIRLRPQDHPDRLKYEDENEILAEILPAYWSAEKIRENLGQIDFSAVNNAGQAMGLAMKHLKGLNAPIEGDTVKKVVVEMMS